MSDLYGTGQSPAETEEISTFLHHLLHNNHHPSSSSSPPPPKFTHLPPPPPSLPPDHHRLGFLEHECGGVNYSDPEGYFGKEKFEKVGSSKRNGGEGFSSDSEKRAEIREAPLDNGRLHRSSSKRSRTAEIHNLSEKRRRSRINEKMKALQNLIPNSNKTDKASMLDEAIEYLKQLQLQVQMLTMRNGLSLHPMCLPGALQPMQLPMTGMNFEEANGILNSNRLASTFSANEESSVQTSLNLPNHCTLTNQPIVVPPVVNIASSGMTFGLEPLFTANYGALNLSTPSKEICREASPHAHLDTTQSMKTSSSGVS